MLDAPEVLDVLDVLEVLEEVLDELDVLDAPPAPVSQPAQAPYASPPASQTCAPWPPPGQAQAICSPGAHAGARPPVPVLLVVPPLFWVRGLLEAQPAAAVRIAARTASVGWEDLMPAGAAASVPVHFCKRFAGAR